MQLLPVIPTRICTAGRQIFCWLDMAVRCKKVESVIMPKCRIFWGTCCRCNGIRRQVRSLRIQKKHIQWRALDRTGANGKSQRRILFGICTITPLWKCVACTYVIWRRASEKCRVFTGVKWSSIIIVKYCIVPCFRLVCRYEPTSSIILNIVIFKKAELFQIVDSCWGTRHFFCFAEGREQHRC